MNIARILYPVQVLGPGNRIGIWMSGCTRGCKGCSNPELWNQRPEYEITIEQVSSLIETVSGRHVVDGFTISGGEPMDQSEELAMLVRVIKNTSTDILLYSGYLIEELRAREDVCTNYILNNIAVLIDGPYIEELNDGTMLRGSANQRFHIIDEKLKNRYQQYLSGAHNQIQNFTTADGVVSVGIHHRGWKTV